MESYPKSIPARRALVRNIIDGQLAGYTYQKRGTAASLDRYGYSKKYATSAQMNNRSLDGFTGKGRYKRRRAPTSRKRVYRGRGGFFDDAWQWTKGAAGWVKDRAAPIAELAAAVDTGQWELAAPIAARLGNQLLGGKGVGKYKIRGIYKFLNTNSFYFIIIK